MKKEEFIFCPLGGSGEIGMNMNLFAYGNLENRKWIIVDIGVTFADETIPGVDLIYPDPGFIVDKRKDLLGLVLTHAHEDHIGAIAHIWPKLLCDIYATPFRKYPSSANNSPTSNSGCSIVVTILVSRLSASISRSFHKLAF